MTIAIAPQALLLTACSLSLQIIHWWITALIGALLTGSTISQFCFQGRNKTKNLPL
jgi:hypothetical protein